MPSVDDEIRRGLERLTDPASSGADGHALWDDLVERRHRRRRRQQLLAGVPLVLVVALVAGFLVTRDTDDSRSDVATGDAATDGESAPSDPVQGSWRLAAVLRTGEENPTSARAVLTIDATQVTGEDGCGNRVSADLDDGRVMHTGARTLVRCSNARDNAAAGFFWEVLRQRPTLSLRDDALWLVVPGGDALIFERARSLEPVSSGSLRVEHIQVVGNGPLEGGTERVRIDFNEPLPGTEVSYIPDITSTDQPAALLYTTQGPERTDVCDSWHGVPDGAVGSVDLLIPAAWFAEDPTAHQGPPLETVDNPAKFVICGPHNGFIQYAIWSPLSADPDDVTVTISPDRKSITIQITPASPPGLDPHAGQAVVATFLDHLRAGDLEDAAELWTGYPEVGPTEERLRFVEALMADPTFARLLTSQTTTTFVTPASNDALSGQAVTILDARSGDTPPAAIAFLTGFSEEQGSPGKMHIHRLPTVGGETVPDPPPGSIVSPGAAIVFPFVPVEGGARAFVNGNEVPVEVDHESFTTTVVVPPDAEGDLAITLVTATPELPSVRAVAVTTSR